MPKTRLGKWAGGLAAVFLALLVALIMLVPSGRGTPGIKMLGVLTAAAGIAAFLTGLVGIFKLKDRSFVVIVAVIIGGLGVFIFVLELLEGIIGG